MCKSLGEELDGSRPRLGQVDACHAHRISGPPGELEEKSGHSNNRLGEWRDRNKNIDQLL
jgi:hypothetical protein